MSKEWGRGLGLACALASGVLWLLSRDIGPFGPLILVAPVPILVYALKSRQALSVAFFCLLARVIGGAGLILAYGRVMSLIYVLVLAQGLLFVAIARFVAALDRRFPPWVAAMGFAITISALDFLIGFISPNGSFGDLGYSLVDVLPLLQVVSLGGICALSFLAAIVPGALSLMIARGFRWSVLAVAVLPVIAACAYGFYQLQPRPSLHVRVAVLADNSQPHHAETAAQSHALAETYAGEAEAQRAQYIVLPEKIVIRRPGWGDLDAPFQAAADHTGATVVAGFDDTPDHGARVNTAHIYRPDMPSVLYLKRHMVPGLEAMFTPGKVSYVDGSVGVAICKDMDFPMTIRQYGKAGVKLMLVPAWDFGLDGRLHARMATVRAVENGFALARAASDGRVTINDAQGRVVAEADSTPPRPVAVTAEVALGSGATVYGRYGDGFGWLMTVVLAAVATMLVVRRNDIT